MLARDVPFPLDVTSPWDSTEIFCGGHVHLPDTNSSLLVVGGTVSEGGSPLGSVGSKHTVIYNPRTYTWSFRDTTTFGRWYPSVTLLGTGEALTTGGKLSRPVTIFGGRQGSVVTNDLRADATSSWAGTTGSTSNNGSNVLWADDAGTGPNPRPLAREGHTLVHYGPYDRYFIWGGLTAGGDTLPNDSLVFIGIGYHDDPGKKWLWSWDRLAPDPTHGRPLARG